MTLQSASYFLFLLVMGTVAWAFPSARVKQRALLLASLVFSLSWGLVSMLLLVVSATFNLLWGLLLKRRPTTSLLWMGLAVNIAWLCLFKYAASLLSWIAGASGDGSASLLVSVGVSFYTFQAMSWLMDIYRGREEDPTATEFLLYMTFWPTILSGPVCRIGEMLPLLSPEA